MENEVATSKARISELLQMKQVIFITRDKDVRNMEVKKRLKDEIILQSRRDMRVLDSVEKGREKEGDSKFVRH